MINDKIKNTLWTEKYRPTTLKDFVGNDDVITKFKSYLKEGDIPHLLLYGKPGCGKTTLAKIVTSNIDCDYLYINASDENNIDTVRNKIKTFSVSVGFKDIKIIVLDEADYITVQGQAALRNLMEVNSKHTRFILTCNYHTRIIDPIISRCQTFEIRPLSKKDIAFRLAYILDNEGITYEVNEEFKTLIDMHYPDIRKTINEAQKYSKNGKLVVDKSSLVESDYRLKIIDILSNEKDKFNKIRQLVANNGIKEFSDLYKLLYENIDKFTSKDSIGESIILIAEGEYQDAFVIDKEITFMATIYRLVGN